VLLLAAGALVSGYAYLAPGHPTSPDVWSHLTRQTIVHQSLREGTSPFYTFMFYSGYPHLRFYPPLFAFLGGLLMFVFRGGPVPAMKVLMFLLHLASGLTMFLFLRRRTRSPWGASIGALVYLLVPWRVVNTAVIANSPQTAVYPFLPLAFLALDRLLERSSLRNVALLGLWCAFLVLGHTFYAVYAVVFVAGWALLRRGWRALPALGAAGLTALVLAGFYVVPFLVQFRGHVYPQPATTLPVPDIGRLLNPWSQPAGYGGTYLGLSAVLLVLGSGVVVFFSARFRREAPVLFGLVLSLLLVFIVPRLGGPGKALTAGLPGVRFLVFLVFFGAALAGSGVAWLEQRIVGRRGLRLLVPLAVGVLLFGDCLPHLLRIRHSTTLGFLDVRQEVYDIIAEQGGTKVLDLDRHGDRLDDFRRLACFPSAGFLHGGLPTALGPAYYQFASPVMRYVYPWVNRLSRELADTTEAELSPDALDGLALMGVSHVVTFPTLVSLEQENGEPVSYVTVKPGLNWDTRFLEMQAEPPLVFAPTGFLPTLASNRIVVLPGEEVVQEKTLMIAGDWAGLLEACNVDRFASSVNFIPVHEGTGPQVLSGSPGVRLLGSEVWHDRVRLSVSVRSDCFLRLAYSFYPWLRLTVDGVETEFSETKDHFIWFRCPAGEHELVLEAPLGPLRTAMLWVSLLGALALAVVLVVRPGVKGGVPGNRR